VDKKAEQDAAAAAVRMALEGNIKGAAGIKAVVDAIKEDEQREQDSKQGK
jgi:hypothetical protein